MYNSATINVLNNITYVIPSLDLAYFPLKAGYKKSNSRNVSGDTEKNMQLSMADGYMKRSVHGIFGKQCHLCFKSVKYKNKS
jgi:hypothetical protein